MQRVTPSDPCFGKITVVARMKGRLRSWVILQKTQRDSTRDRGGRDDQDETV